MKRRFELRRAVRRPIEVISSLWDEALRFVTGDLTPRGAYVLSDLLPPTGDNLVCSFDLGLGRPFDLFGEVVRVNMMRRRTDVGPPGFAVRFLDAGPRERLSIRRALLGLPPPLPGHRRAGLAPALASAPTPTADGRLIAPARGSIL